MTWIEDLIDRLLSLPTVTPSSVGGVCGVKLSKDDENPYWEMWEGGPSNGLERVWLNLAKERPAYLLAFDPIPQFAPLERDIDMTRYGQLTQMEVNPDLGPEGIQSYVYFHNGVRLAIQIRTTSRRVHSVSLQFG